MKNICKTIFIIATVIYLLLLIPCFLSAWSADDGNLTKQSSGYIFVEIYDVLRFPTHTLLWKLIMKGGVFTFASGLIINCMFYGLVTERLIFLFRQKNVKIDNKENLAKTRI